MPASCSAQGALTELLFPPFHNLFPRSLAYALMPSTFTNPKKLTRREPFPSIFLTKFVYYSCMGKVATDRLTDEASPKPSPALL